MIGVAAPDPARIAFLSSVSYAHRGLHGPDGPIENSLPAFAAAIGAGHGIECDVRLSSDGVPFVFHDRLLDRLTGQSGPLSTRTASQLDTVMLNRDSGAIPRLSALLALARGRVPLLIEIKIDHHAEIAPLCAAVGQELAAYEGPAAAMSFHPGAARWFRTHAPGIVRGLVVTEEGRKGWRGRLSRHLAMRAAHPDFLAYDIRDLPSPFAGAARAAGFPLLSWTVRDEDQWRTIRTYADAAIFERPASETA